MEKIILVDGTGLVNRYYYKGISAGKMETGNPDFQAAPSDKGYYVDALEPFVLKLLQFERLGYTKIACCFDSARALLNRKELFPEYKAQRTETPRALSQQTRNAQWICNQLGIKAYRAEGIEADDFVGTLARIFSQRPNNYIDIITGDHDYLQLVSKNSAIGSCSNVLIMTNEQKREAFGYDESTPTGAIRYTTEIFERETGLKYPRQIVDLKAIAGDSSDNYPGIKGVGEKAALALLKHYKNLEEIYADIDTKTDDELRALWKGYGVPRPNPGLFRENKETAFICKKIAKIDTHLDESPIKMFKAIFGRELTDAQKQQEITVSSDINDYNFSIDRDQLRTVSDKLGLSIHIREEEEEMGR